MRAGGAGAGHEARLIPPRYVRPVVKTNQNDAADTEAIFRGGDASDDALCAFAPRRAAIGSDAAPGPRAPWVRQRNRGDRCTARPQGLESRARHPDRSSLKGRRRGRNGSPSSKIPVICDGRLWRARRWALWSSDSVPLGPGSSSGRRCFWHGTDRTRRAAVFATIGDGAQVPLGPTALGPARFWCPGNTRVAARAGGGRISKRGDGTIRRWLVQGARTRAARAPRQAGSASRLDRPAPGAAADKRRAGRQGR